MSGYATIRCHGCDTVVSQSDGCPRRVLICKKCRRDPKKLDEARKAMWRHMWEEHEVKMW